MITKNRVKVAIQVAENADQKHRCCIYALSASHFLGMQWVAQYPQYPQSAPRLCACTLHAKSLNALAWGCRATVAQLSSPSLVIQACMTHGGLRPCGPVAGLHNRLTAAVLQSSVEPRKEPN
jgi:hypothetical protein